MQKNSQDSKITFAQKPNPPIIIAFIFWVASKLTDGSLSDFLGMLTSVTLIAWGMLELFWGINAWRKILGGAVIILSIYSLFNS